KSQRYRIQSHKLLGILENAARADGFFMVLAQFRTGLSPNQDFLTLPHRHVSCVILTADLGTHWLWLSLSLQLLYEVSHRFFVVDACYPFWQDFRVHKAILLGLGTEAVSRIRLLLFQFMFPNNIGHSATFHSRQG